MADLLPLSPIQVRILACLIEKKATTPDQYPLTLNALRNACNQKTNRFPVVSYNSGEIGHELRVLEQQQLVRMERSARAERYEHRLGPAFDLRPRDVAILCTLMLRGPQTLAEIKARTYPVLGLDDATAVKDVLDRLSGREPALAVQIPRQPGQKEERYTHLLAGEPDLSQIPVSSGNTRNTGALEQRIEALENEVAAIRGLLEKLLQARSSDAP